jgi:hypothetical protein
LKTSDVWMTDHPATCLDEQEMTYTVRSQSGGQVSRFDNVADSGRAAAWSPTLDYSRFGSELDSRSRNNTRIEHLEPQGTAGSFECHGQYNRASWPAR